MLRRGERGLGWHPSGKVYATLLSGEVVAIDATTGREIWRVRNTDPKLGGTLAAAPLVVGSLVIVGVSARSMGWRAPHGLRRAHRPAVWRGYSTDRTRRS